MLLAGSREAIAQLQRISSSPWRFGNCGKVATQSAVFLRNPGQSRVIALSVDTLARECYNNGMMRKKRTDRNHIVYELRVNGAAYIGVTAKTETTINKSVLARAAKHFYRAKTENKDWLLCQALRGLNDKSEIEVLVHEVIRGKAAAHKREVEIRRALKPVLNTDRRGD
jgi:hypothetical protein